MRWTRCPRRAAARAAATPPVPPPTIRTSHATSSAFARLPTATTATEGSPLTGTRMKSTRASSLFCIVSASPGHGTWQPQRNLRERHDQPEHDHLEDQVRPDRPEDLAQRDAGRRYTLEVERCGTEWRRNVRNLHVQAEQCAEPDKVETELLGNRHEDRRRQKKNADPVDEATE